MLSTKVLYAKLKEHHSEQKALMIMQFILVDYLKGDLEPLTIWGSSRATSRRARIQTSPLLVI